MNSQSDTIAAIATAMGNSGVGIIRISGDRSVEIADLVFKGKRKLKDCQSHTIEYGHIYSDDGIIDEVLVLIMLSPKSYTTEDVIEIQCHGGIFVLKTILSLIIEKGARLAEPGEFTKRAFLNGRIDLSEAESVMDLISSNSSLALKNSAGQMAGSLNKIICDLRDKILFECAYIESALDDPEHYDLNGYSDELKEKIHGFNSEIKRLIDSFDSGQIIKDGVNTLIIGKPNAGKSSLLNSLLNKERAIVTDIPGTTRDILNEQALVNGVVLNIMDTAGIRKTDDIVEKLGIDRAVGLIDDADLILFVVDSSSVMDENDEYILNKVSDKNVIVLLNKSDLTAVISESDIKDKCNKPIISFSSVTLDGMDDLKNMISDMFLGGKINSNDFVFITNVRQVSCLKNAYTSLENVLESISIGMTEDFFTVDLMDAYGHLGEITGETIEDDLADKIFSEFCMGK